MGKCNSDHASLIISMLAAGKRNVLAVKGFFLIATLLKAIHFDLDSYRKVNCTKYDDTKWIEKYFDNIIIQCGEVSFGCKQCM